MIGFPHTEKMDANWHGPLGSMLRTVGMVGAPPRWKDSARNLGLWIQATKNLKAMETWSQYFDLGYYVQTHPDVIQRGVDPLIHFLLYGNRDRLRPSAQFDIDYYLSRYPDVEKTRVNALLHYALFGRAEGRTLNWIKSPVEPEQRAEQNGAEIMATVASAVVNNQWTAEQPLLSVIIPCFNYGQHVEEALRSVLGQTFRDLEIIVVDGGSTDSSTLEKLGELEAKNLPGVKFLYRQGRHLVGDNRNFAIGQARGRYVCCLDADDLLLPIYCESAVFLAEAFGYDIVYCSSQCFGEMDFRWLLTDASFPEIAHGNQISTIAVHRKSAWAHVGGYRDWGLHEAHIPEDWDYWTRMVGHGFRPKSIREPLFLYRVHNAGLTGTTETTRDQQRQAILESNSGLFLEHQAPSPGPVRVLNRWANLAKSDGDPRPGFLLALPFVTVGGAETLLYGVAEAVARSGFRLVVITSLMLPASVPDQWRSFERITPHVYPLPRLFHDPGTPDAFISYLIRRYRVSHLFFAGCELIYHLLPELAAVFPDLRVVDQLFNDKGHIVNNRHYRRHIDATIVPSSRVKASLHERTPEDPGQVYVVPHAVTVPEPETRSISRIRACLELPENRIIIAFFGRLSEEKGAAVFVEIARALAPGQRFYFILTGEGPERGRVMELINRYELSASFYAPGFVEDVNPLMNAADIIVVPSLLDGMPLVVLESHAREKPVVASAVGSIPVMVEDGETGYLCEPGDVDAFVRRIVELADDPAKRRQFGRAGRAAVRRNNSGDKMLQSYFEVFGIGATEGG